MAENKKILVVGGTGMLGFPVAQALFDSGYDIRILTREPLNAEKKLGSGLEYLEGDVRSMSSLRNIIKHYHGIHINLNSRTFDEMQEVEVKGTANVAKASVDAGIKKITMISGLGIHEKNTWSSYVQAKFDAEKAVKMSGIPYTIFNCTHFMESIPAYIRNGKAMVIGSQPHPVHWLAARDYARMVVESYEEKKSDYKNIPVLGPEKLTMEGAFQKYAAKSDENITVSKVSIKFLSFMATITFNKTLRYIVDMMKYFSKIPEPFGREHMPDYLSLPRTTLDEWLELIKT